MNYLCVEKFDLLHLLVKKVVHFKEPRADPNTYHLEFMK